ncbi:MAG TPA: hypothetical protein VF395_16155, partial [Polyangiaceae bacterium]
NRMTRVACFGGYVLGLVGALIGAGCAGAPGGGAAPRSPSEEQSGAQTSNGEVVGADQVPPGEKLETGPRVGSQGIVPAGQPPHGKPKQHR